MIGLIALSFMFLFYVWIAYPFIVGIAAYWLRQKKNCKIAPSFEYVTIIIPTHNEVNNLKRRIDNIYDSNYPELCIEVLIALDGSNDNSVILLNELSKHYKTLKWVEIKYQGGRANAHNLTIKHANGNILIFTDAETVFTPDFIRNITNCFADSKVGFASGVLGYTNQKYSGITSSASVYWKFEMWLREMESRLGINAFGTGACCAVRKDLFKSIPPTGDVDFTTPLDVVLQGYKSVHVPNAYAVDQMPQTAKQEFQSRVRMTAKNLAGTISRWGLHNCIRHPVYTWVILSHKILRWMTPFGMLGLLAGSLAGAIAYDTICIVLLVFQSIFYLLALAGGLNVRLRLAAASYSFVLANTAFLFGIMKAIFGRVPASYRPVSQS